MAVHEVKAATIADVRSAHPTAAIIRPAVAHGTGRHWLVFDRADDAIGHASSERR